MLVRLSIPTPTTPNCRVELMARQVPSFYVRENEQVKIFILKTLFAIENRIILVLTHLRSINYNHSHSKSHVCINTQ